MIVTCFSVKSYHIILHSLWVMSSFLSGVYRFAGRTEEKFGTLVM